MADDLGSRLVQAGLVTPHQLGRVRGSAPPHEAALVTGLVGAGLSEEALAGFFVAAGFGPLMDERDLGGAEPSAVARLQAEIARELLVLPIRESPAGLIVAMAAPTDAHAVAEVARAAGGTVLPTVARLTELSEALRRTYPALPRPQRDSEAPPLELVQVRRKPEPGQDGYLGSTRGAERVEARALVGPRLVPDEEESYVPLVRHKPVIAPAPAQKPKVITKSFEKPSAGDLAKAREGAWSAPPPRSIIPLEHSRWDIDEPRENKVDPGRLRSLSSPPRRSQRPSPIGGTLAAIRASRDRDEVVELACRGALTACRAAVLLALKKGVLKGWDGAGAGLTRDVVRNLWIPTSSPSMFREVVARARPYDGPHGTSAADGLFRAAVGSRGGDVVLMPVGIGGKVVAVLAADDVSYGDEGKERIEILARAVSEAFERIIVITKHR